VPAMDDADLRRQIEALRRRSDKAAAVAGPTLQLLNCSASSGSLARTKPVSNCSCAAHNSQSDKNAGNMRRAELAKQLEGMWLASDLDDGPRAGNMSVTLSVATTHRNAQKQASKPSLQEQLSVEKPLSLGDPDRPWVEAGGSGLSDSPEHSAQQATIARLRQAEEAKARVAAEDAELYRTLALKQAERARQAEEATQQRDAESKTKQEAAEAHRAAASAQRAAKESVLRARREAAMRTRREEQQRQEDEKKQREADTKARNAKAAQTGMQAAEARVAQMSKERSKQARALADAKRAEEQERVEALRKRANVRAHRMQLLEVAASRRQLAIQRVGQKEEVFSDALKRAAARHDFKTLELVKAKPAIERDREIEEFLEQQREKQAARQELMGHESSREMAALMQKQAARPALQSVLPPPNETA
jgi:hypothetical protein